MASTPERTYEDLIRAGIIDPTKVTRYALQNAATVAGLLMTTEAMVAEKPKKESRCPMAAAAWAAWAAWKGCTKKDGRRETGDRWHRRFCLCETIFLLLRSLLSINEGANLVSPLLLF